MEISPNGIKSSFLISDGKLPMSETDLGKVFDEYAAELGRMNEPNQELLYEDSNLPQWRQYIAQNISNYTNEWADAYIESAAWDKRSKGVTESILKTALLGLLTYVSQQGWLNEQRADKFKKYLAASEPKMVELSKDPQNFSDSKILTLKMLERGIDLEDKAAVQRYIDEINKQGGIDYLRELAKNLSEVNDTEGERLQDTEEIAKFSDPEN